MSNYKDNDFDRLNNEFNNLHNFLYDFIEPVIDSNNLNNICYSCNDNNFIEDSHGGTIVCMSCGLVFKNLFDESPEWKQYDDNDRSEARCNQSYNVLLPQSSLGTCIYGANGTLRRLQIWNKMPSRERSLNNEFKSISNVCQKYEIMKCVEDDTKIMYKIASECKHQIGDKKDKQIITRGINRKSIKAACLWYACVKKGITRTSKEMAKMWDINENELNKGRRNLKKLFEIKEKTTKSLLRLETSKADHFVKRYCQTLNLKTIYTNDAIKISINIEKLNLMSSHTPCSTASASLLLMANIHNLCHITKSILSSLFEISESTIVKTYKKIEPYKHVLINDEYTDEVVEYINTTIKPILIPKNIENLMEEFEL
jgi:transcription initiation factor TFIIIB Brf1 subunit/transcription initiation factor TFIIB